MSDVIHIGERNKFGIDIQFLEDSNKFSGYCQLIINGKPLGYFGDQMYLDTLYKHLKNIKNLSDSTYLNKNLPFLNTINFIKKLNNNKIGSKMLPGLPENFDDFNIRIFKYGNDVYFLWKLNDKPYFKYDIDPKEIFFEKIKSAIFYKAIDELAVILGV